MFCYYFFFTFCFEAIIDLREVAKNSAEMPQVSMTQFLLMVTFYIIMVILFFIKYLDTTIHTLAKFGLLWYLVSMLW